MSEDRWLDSEKTAKYISVRVGTLPRLVRLGRIPKPHYEVGPRSPRWDRLSLDAAFEGGADSTDIQEMIRASVQKIRESGRARRRKNTDA